MNENSVDDFGFPGSSKPNTYAGMYRVMAQIGAVGFGALGKNCVLIACIGFALAIASAFGKAAVCSYLQERNPTAFFWVSFLWPSLSAMAIPMMTGTYWVIPVFFAWMAMEAWQKINRLSYEKRYQILGASIIVGFGVWSLFETILKLAGVDSPMNIVWTDGDGNGVDKYPWAG